MKCICYLLTCFIALAPSVLAAPNDAAATQEAIPTAKWSIITHFKENPLDISVRLQDCGIEMMCIVPKEGFKNINLSNPSGIYIINRSYQKTAYKSEVAIDGKSKTVNIALKDIGWKPLNIIIYDDLGKPVPNHNVKIRRKLDRATDIDYAILSTDKEGKIVTHCEDDITYYLICDRPPGKPGYDVTSGTFTTKDLDAKGNYTYKIPTYASESIRFRFVVKVNGRMEHLEDFNRIEVAGLGSMGAFDGVFYLQSDGSDRENKLLAKGAICQIYLLNRQEAKYDFADGKGTFVVGNLGDMVDIELTPRVRYQITATILDADGKPINTQSKLCYRRVGMTNFSYTAKPVATDLIDGKYELSLWAPGYQLAQKVVEAKDGKVEFRLQPGTEAEFVVTDNAGKPLGRRGQVEIYYQDRDMGLTYHRELTDVNGKAKIAYDPNHKPFALIEGIGHAPHMVAVSKDTKIYPIQLHTVPPTEIALSVAQFDERFPAAENIREIAIFSVKPGRHRILNVDMGDGKGAMVLEPGEYVPAVSYTGIKGADPRALTKFLIGKPFIITAEHKAVEFVPDRIGLIEDVQDGL